MNKAFIVSLIQIVMTVVEVLLGIRLILRLFGASNNAAFSRWVYQTTQPLLEPFLGLFPAPALNGRFVLEFSTLFALLVYSIIGYVFIQVVSSIKQATPTQSN